GFRLILFLLFFSVTVYPMSNNFKFLTSILGNFAFENYTGERTFGYPLLMAFCLNNNYLLVFAQLLIGVFTWVFWYKTLLNVKFSPKISFYITLFSGSFIHIFLYETSVMLETVLLLVISWIFYLLSNGYLEKSNRKTDWLMALLVAYLIMLKPFFVYVPFLIYGFSVLKDFRFKAFISHKIIIVLSGLFCYFGWSYINKLHTGHFVSSTFLGLNLAQNCVHFAENTTEEYRELGNLYAKHREIAIKENKEPAMSVWYAGDEIKQLINIDYFPDYSAYLGEYAKATIALNKEQYIEQVITVSWVDFWKSDIYWEFIQPKYPFVKPVLQNIWNIQEKILIGLKLIFILLIPWYIIRFICNRKITFALVVITFVLATSVLQAIVTYGTNSRYSYPFEYLMIIVVFLTFFRSWRKSA
ncbi:MAG: hypothetical protein WCY89_05095, partial [Flavobacteriaceae bacterium]